MRAFAHAGLLHEMGKAKIPIFAIAGLEMGALPASLFAMKAQPFEPEWQMMKISEKEFLRQGLLGGEAPQKIEALRGFFQTVFGGLSIENSKLPFFCPSYSTQKKQTFLLNRGSWREVLPYCLPFPPLFSVESGLGANL